MPPVPLPIKDSEFTLDSAAVAGFFGGEEAISAMATVHLYKGRRWLGWYNSPGSYTIAKQFGKMANSRLWDGLFPGPNDSPAVSFGLDGKKGPEYVAALSGTKMPTGHLAYLTMKRCKETKLEKIGGRKTKPCDIGYLAMNPIDDDVPVERRPLRDALFGLIPIAASVVTSIMCALVSDWFSFSMIALGIVCSGLASFVIGKGRLVIKPIKPADGCPAGHGMLKGEVDVVVIKGREQDVNAITKGSFDLDTSGNAEGKGKKQGDEERAETKPNGEKRVGKDQEREEKGQEKQDDDEEDAVCNYHAIGICSLLLLAQFLAQLLLIPRGHLFGQIMFIVSLAVSWGYNSYLSSLEKEKIQTDILFDTLKKPVMRRFRAGTHTTMAVFVCLLLFHNVEKNLPEEEEEECDRRKKVLDSLIPNDTPVWRQWKRRVIKQLLDDKNSSLPYLKERVAQPAKQSDQHPAQVTPPPKGVPPSPGQFVQSPDSTSEYPEDNAQYNLRLSDGEKLLEQLLEDATAAFKKYIEIYRDLPRDSSQFAANGH